MLYFVKLIFPLKISSRTKYERAGVAHGLVLNGCGVTSLKLLRIAGYFKSAKVLPRKFVSRVKNCEDSKILSILFKPLTCFSIK